VTRVSIATWVLLGACGRFGFEPRLGDPDAAAAADADPTDAANPVADASVVDGIPADASPCTADPGCTAFTCGGACFQTCSAASSWAQAQVACAAWGGCLATIDSAAKTTCIAGLAADSWIGLEQVGGVEPAGGWQWVCGGAVVYTNWMATEPNDGGNEDCGEVKELAIGRWNDLNCSFARAFVCERP
jgi:hypothetical protein